MNTIGIIEMDIPDAGFDSKELREKVKKKFKSLHQ